MKRILPIVGLLLVIVLALGWFLTVRIPADTVGVVEAAAPGAAPAVLGPGVHLRPLGSLGARIAMYSTLPATAEGEALLTPASGGEIPARYKVTARLDPAHAGELHAALAGQTIDQFLKAKTEQMLREYAARTEAVEALAPQFRSRAAEDIVAVLKKGGFEDATLTLRPPDQDTLLAAAQYLAPRNEAWKIRQTVSEALVEPGGSGSWKLATAMGLVNESEKLFSEAEKNYLDALAIDPAALPPMSELVSLYSAVKEWEKLQRVLDAALAANPKSLQHINWMAVVLMKLDDDAGAERILKSGLEVDPKNTTLLANLGTLYMKMNRVDEAIALFRQAEEAAPSSQQALFNLGSALAATGRFAEALPFLERAEQAQAPSLPLVRTLAFLYEKTGDAAKASAYRAKTKSMEAEQEAARRQLPQPPARGKTPAPSAGARKPS